MPQVAEDLAVFPIFTNGHDAELSPLGVRSRGLRNPCGLAPLVPRNLATFGRARALLVPPQTAAPGASVLVAVGLNRKVASVEDREVLALAEEDLAPVLAGWAALDGVDEVAVLSTCYRVEIYAAARFAAVAARALRTALASRAGRDVPLFELHGEAAFCHLVRVAGSLESAILGEPQILGQVKDAFARAAASGAAGAELAGLSARALAAAKRIRSETALGRAGVSWGHAAAALAGKVLGPLRGRQVLVVGAGEMARLSAQHLAAQGAALTILNRTVDKAAALAGEVGGRHGGLCELGARLQEADLVVSAAPAAPPELAPAALSMRMALRRRPLVLVDLAVPRAIPPASGDLEGVYLCDVDDLDRVMRAAQAERATAAAAAERIVQEEVERFRAEEAERRAAPMITELRTRAGAIARQEVERTLRRLGGDPDLERRLDALAGAIVAKLLHLPSTRLKEAARRGPAEGGDVLLGAAARIFELGEVAGADAPGP
jgi:glutamyl-tRNA reductase